MGDPGGETGRVTFPLDPHPGGTGVIERCQGFGIDRGAVASEQDEQTLVGHAAILPDSIAGCVI